MLKPIEEKTDLRTLTRVKLQEEGWKQEQLAHLLGTSRQVVCNWINGRKGLPYKYVETLLYILGFRELPKELPKRKV